MKPYLFTSQRLGFRLWTPSDLAPLSALNADPDVMRFFPSTQTKEQSSDFMDRMNAQFQKLSYCYWAVDLLESKQLIGFIGLSQPDFTADFLPNVDIGWRLDPQFWNKGYATEGAQRCLHFGKENLGLKKVIAIAPKVNLPSTRVMEKIGFHRKGEFVHPKLDLHSPLQPCLWFATSLKQVKETP